MAGRLFVIATPLGNLDDITPRAVATLREVGRIACEDTRRTSKILARFGITTPTMSYHRFNEHARLEPVLSLLLGGTDVALVSDGGTPGIADPGAALVRAALDASVDVVPIPGPSAVAAILSICGEPADRFVFEGFLPHRAGERRRRLRELVAERRPIVIYEAPHRIRQTLADLQAVLGPRGVVLAREMTKVHETILRGTPPEVAAALPRGEVRGEIAMVVAGATDDGAVADTAASMLIATWRDALEQSGGDRKRALRAASKTLGWDRAELYRRLAELDLAD